MTTMYSNHVGNDVATSDVPLEKPTTASPVDVSQMVEKVAPYIEKLSEFVEKVQPYYLLAKEKVFFIWNIVKPYYEEYYDPAYGRICLGICLLLWGGNFAMTIACYSAIQIAGWPSIKKSYYGIKENWDKAMLAAQSDEEARNLLDADGDGDISWAETGKIIVEFAKSNNQRRWEIMTALKACFIAVNPNQVMDGLVGFWMAALSVVATLRSKFAKDVALGVSIGEMLSANLKIYLVPPLAHQVDDKLKPWVEFIVVTGCKTIGVAIALTIARAISALHSALKGGQLIAIEIFHFLDSKDLLQVGVAENLGTMESNKMFMALQYSLALYGFFQQVRSGFAITSIFLRLILFPLVLLETILTIVAAWQ